MVALATIDFVVMAAYLVATFGFALWAARRRTETTTDYFLAGRDLPWYLIGFSYYASNMSGASFVGLIGASYSYGLAVFHYEWTATLVLALFAVFILPVFLRNRIFTAPQYLEIRFDARARLTYALFTLVLLLLIDTAGSLYAGALVLTKALPGVDLWTACAVLALFAGVYTIFGGLRAVVITDSLQAVVMIVAALALGFYGLWAVGGWTALIEQVGPDHAMLFRPAGDAQLPWPGILGIVLLGFYYWTFDQYFVQRALAARSIAAGRRGALFGGLLKLPNIVILIIPGLVAAALYPNLEHADDAFPMLTLTLLPPGLRAVILAALLAAIMSSLDSVLNAAASIVTIDLIQPRRPAISDQTLVRIGRGATAVVMVVAALYAPLIAGFETLFDYFQKTLAYLVPAIAAVYLGGLTTRRFSPDSAFPTMAVMLPLGVVVFLVKEVSGVWADLGLPAIHYTVMAIVIFVLALVVMALFSLMSAETLGEAARSAVITRADVAPDDRSAPVWSNHRVQATALMVLTAVLLAVLGWAAHPVSVGAP